MTLSVLPGLSAEALDLVLATIHEGLILLDAQRRVTYLNKQAAELLGMPSEPLLNGYLWDCISAFQVAGNELEHLCQCALLTQLPLESEDYQVDSGQFLQIRIVPFQTGLILYLQNLTTQKQTQARLRYYDAREQLLVAIDQRIRQSVDLDEILNTAVVEIRSFLEADRVLIYRLNDTELGQLVAQSCKPGWQLADPRQAPATSVISPLYSEQGWHQSDQVCDVTSAKLPPLELERLQKFEVKARLMVPIFQDQRPWGFLSVHQCNVPRQWQPLEVLLLKELATQIAIAIQQSELYWRTQNLKADLEQQVLQRTQELEQAIAWEAMLKRITDRVRDSLDEKQILQQAVQELALALNVSSCNAALYDLEKRTSTIYYEYATTIPASQGRVARMANYPELYNQLLRAEHFQFCSIIPNPVRGRVTMLACPIFDNEGVLGDLWLVNAAHHSFSEVEIRFVQQAANQCAIALRQAKLYQAAQAQVAELEELNRLKDEFLSTVSHELRTPMTNMKMAILMLDLAVKQQRSDLESCLPPSHLHPLNQRVNYYLDILRQECEREIQLINDLLDLQRLEANAQELNLETLNLQEWLLHRVEMFRDRIHDRQQSLKLEIAENLPAFTTDANSLGRILAELLNNACKYTPRREEICLNVTATNHTIQIQVTNSGVEIPQSELSRIFDKFYRIPSNDPWKEGGTGLGLALIKKLAQHLGGVVKAESASQTTCFTISLPLNLQTKQSVTDNFPS